MAEVVKSTARLTEEDRRAIAVFLQSVPAKPSARKEIIEIPFRHWTLGRDPL